MEKKELTESERVQLDVCDLIGMHRECMSELVELAKSNREKVRSKVDGIGERIHLAPKEIQSEAKPMLKELMEVHDRFCEMLDEGETDNGSG